MLPEIRLIGVVGRTAEGGATDVGPLEAAYRGHRTELLRLACLLVGNQSDAEDLVQDVFTRYGQLDVSPANPKFYLRQMIVNAARDLFRYRAVRSQRPVRPNRQVGTRDYGLLWDAVMSLSHDQREVIVLRYYNDLSHTEIAQVIGSPVGTVRSRFARALAQLREVLP